MKITGVLLGLASAGFFAAGLLDSGAVTDPTTGQISATPSGGTLQFVASGLLAISAFANLAKGR